MKSIAKLLFLSFLVALIVNSFSSVSFAKTNKEPSVSSFSNYEKRESNLLKSDSGKTVYEIKDLKKGALELGVPLKNEKGEELISLAYSYTEEQEEEPQISPMALYIKVTGTGEACGTTVIRSSYYEGPATATMSIKSGVEATYSSNFGVSSAIVTAGVGFDVTKTFEVSDTYSVTVPAGATYNIKAKPIYLIKNFQIWDDPAIGFDTEKGTGTAMKPIGVCFAVYK